MPWAWVFTHTLKPYLSPENFIRIGHQILELLRIATALECCQGQQKHRACLYDKQLECRQWQLGAGYRATGSRAYPTGAGQLVFCVLFLRVCLVASRDQITQLFAA